MDRDALLSLAARHGAEARFGELLAGHTSLGIGGAAAFFIRPAGWGSVPALLAEMWSLSLPFRILGGGTNILVQDGPLDFGVVSLGSLKGGVRFEGRLAHADADLPLPALCALAARRGLSGLEGMEGIPGTVGGGLAMNAGAFGCEMGDVVRDVRLASPEAGERRVPAASLGFAYRKSSVRSAGVALGCTLELRPGDADEIRSNAAEIRARRQSSQPWREATAGSIFKNPPGDFAGRVLQSLGFKGRGRGGAAFSTLHANFLVNRGGATFSDAFALLEEARGAALKEGIELEYEVEIWRASEGSP